MWRRYHCRMYVRAFRSPRPCLRLMALVAALVVGLAGLAAFSQDTTPPPPPDAQAASPAAGGEQTQAENPNQSTVRTVRVSDVEGQVAVYLGDEVAFNQAQPNMPAVEGMRFVTGDNGRLEIELEDGSVVRATPNSSIRLAQLQRSPDGSTVTEIDALTGLTFYELNGRAGQISVRFGQESAAPEGNAIFRIALDTVPNELALMHGSVRVSDGQNVNAELHPSQTFQVDPQQPGQYNIAQSITADSWDQWNSDRDEALAELEANETTARASSGNPDDAAWNDLDYYGSWYNLPGYGQVWAPNGVDAGWDPFGSGYWGYYPTFGYTWISGYPWGWWPYHCGAWDFVDGWGWIWIPGNCGWGLYGAGWFPYATVWRVPHGYLLPPRPHHGPGLHPGPHPQPLLAVNRGPGFGMPFRQDHGTHAVPRPLLFGGKTIAPLEAEIHPQEKGPVGESFTATMVRAHPEMVTPAMRAQGSAGYRAPYTPAGGVRTFGAAPGYIVPHAGEPSPGRGPYTGPVSRPSPGGGAAPHPSGGGATPHPSGGSSPHR